MIEVQVDMCLDFSSFEFTAGNNIRYFPSPFLNSTSWFFILAGSFRNDHVAACRTALFSATEKHDMGGYVTVPSSSKMTQLSSSVDWINFQ